eukprot:1150515-Pelagomonas_calceolata.AAC.6
MHTSLSSTPAPASTNTTFAHMNGGFSCIVLLLLPEGMLPLLLAVAARSTACKAAPGGACDRACMHQRAHNISVSA